MGYSPWGPKELDTTERLHTFPLFTFFCLVGNHCLFFKPLSPLAGFYLSFCLHRVWNPERRGPACLTGSCPLLPVGSAFPRPLWPCLCF